MEPEQSRNRPALAAQGPPDPSAPPARSRAREASTVGVNLFVYDDAGKEVGKDVSPGPKCSVKVTPTKDGNYKFVITNAGGENTVIFKVEFLARSRESSL